MDELPLFLLLLLPLLLLLYHHYYDYHRHSNHHHHLYYSTLNYPHNYRFIRRKKISWGKHRNLDQA